MIHKKNIFFLVLSLANCITMSARQEVKKAFIVSGPKSGTHLAAKLAKKLMKGRYKNATKFHDFNMKEIQNLSSNTIYLSHAPCIANYTEFFEREHIRGIFIYRDPRDQLISSRQWIYQHPAVWPELQHLHPDDLLLTLINNYPWAYPFGTKSINNTYQYYLSWQKHPYVYTTTFERLVGPQGGGTREEQLTEIYNIAKHLNKDLSQEQAEQLANQLFGGTNTFRNGKIGAWKKKSGFKAVHKRAFKKVAGKLLIKLGYEKDLNW